MILEHVVLPVIPGREAEFLSAFDEAQPILSSMEGFIDFSLSRGIERPNEFLLLVRWRTLEDHTVGFRQSTEYVRWSSLLHHFYEPFPEVTHFRL